MTFGPDMTLGIEDNVMDKPKISRAIVILSASGATMWLCTQIIIALGVDRKSWFEIFFDILGGGTAGAAVGVICFLVFGAIGWVSGAIYGALGLFSLMLGGALGGLGLGALVHILRNPAHYNFNFPVIIVGALATYFLVNKTASMVGKLYDEHGPSLVKWFMEKYGD